MIRKQLSIPVAILNDDGTSRIVGHDELRTRQKFSAAEMLQYLAIHQRNPDLGIPAAVIDAIAIAVGGKDEWDKILGKLAGANGDRQAESDRVGQLLRAEAGKLRTLNPGISDERLADILRKTTRVRSWVAKDDSGVLSARAIRRHIAKNR